MIDLKVNTDSLSELLLFTNRGNVYKDTNHFYDIKCNIKKKFH